jgi:hypothetical protein
MGSGGMASDDEKLDARRKAMLERALERNRRAIEDRPAEKLRRAMSRGGQAIMRAGAKAEVFTRHGDKLERESPGGEETQVSHLLDPRLKLTDLQRATGNCYGHYAQSVTGGRGKEFLREYVDQSPGSGGGATVHQVHVMRMIEVAHKAIGQHPAIVYPLGRVRGFGHVGPHRKIKAQTVLDWICRDGNSLQYVAVQHGWVVERQGGKQVGTPVVPDRQRKHLAEALRCILDDLVNAWDAKGYSIPYEFTRLVVK